MATPQLPIDQSACSLPRPVPSDARERSRRALRPVPLLVALAGILTFAYVGFHACIAWVLTHPPVVSLHSNPMAAKGLDYRDVTFPSADGRSLVDGWWIPGAPDTGANLTVVLSHGYGANREEMWVPMYDVARWLHDQGYNVLMFDYGFADPHRHLPATGGVHESRELLGALRYAREAGSEKLVVWGFSMGAGTALLAGLEADSHAIDGMILDSTFVPTDETMFQNIRHYAALPRSSLALIRLFLPLWGGVTPDQFPAEAVWATSYPFPIFLVHGTNDAKAPLALAEQIARAQRNPDSSLWVVPGAIHEMMFRTHAEEYTRRAAAFLDRVAAGPALVAADGAAADDTVAVGGAADGAVAESGVADGAVAESGVADGAAADGAAADGAAVIRAAASDAAI